MDNLYWLDQIQLNQHLHVGDHTLHLSHLAQKGYPVIPGFAISAHWFREFLDTLEWADPLFLDLAQSSLRVNVEDPRQLQAVAQQIRHTIVATPLPTDWVVELEAMVKALPPVTASQLNQAVVLRPSLALSSPRLDELSTPLPLEAANLLEAQICWLDRSSLETGLKILWAELFRARNLVYWQRSQIQLHQIHFSVLVQPIGAAISSGYLQNPHTDWEVLATWGLEPAIANGEVIPDFYRLDANNPGVQSQKLGSKTIAYQIRDLSEGASCPPLQLTPLQEAQDKQFVLDSAQLQQFGQLSQRLNADFGSWLLLEWVLYPNEHNQAQLYLTQIKTQISLLAQGEIEAVSLHSQSQHQEISRLIVSGLAAAPGRAIAKASVISDLQHLPTNLEPGTILVTSVIMPDWLPLLKQAAGVIAEQGGMTSHGAIVARELGIPAVIGAMQATQRIKTGDSLLINGDRGTVYEATALLKREFAAQQEKMLLSQVSDTPTGTRSPITTQLMVNLSQSDLLDRAARLPINGLGLLRSELMVIELLDQHHPHWWTQKGRQSELTDRLFTQISKFARAFAPRPVFYRSLDLRSHEFRALDGGDTPFEMNPMLGVRGTFSYVLNPVLFDLELAALNRIYQAGYSNVRLVLPFVRTVEEFIFCRQRVEQAGLTRHPDFQLWIMAEVPSVLFLLPEYVQAGVQGIAIGINDLTQLLLGVDRDLGLMAVTFDEYHPAVLRAIAQLIESAHKLNIPCSICGLAPVQSPKLINSLVQWGITAISVNIEAVESTYQAIEQAEKKQLDGV